MKIRNDLLRVASGMAHVDGTKAEPEEQPVERRLIVDSDTTTADGQATKTNVPVHIVSEMSAGVLAKKLSAPCSTCAYFDRKPWLKLLAITEADGTTAPLHVREQINEVRASLLMTNNASLNEMHTGSEGDMDVEHALHSMGFCRALTENNADHEEVIVHPTGCCPAEVISESAPMGFYKVKDSIAKKEAVSAYDAVFRQAQGKLP